MNDVNKNHKEKDSYISVVMPRMTTNIGYSDAYQGHYMTQQISVIVSKIA